MKVESLHLLSETQCQSGAGGEAEVYIAEEADRPRVTRPGHLQPPTQPITGRRQNSLESRDGD